MSKKLAEGIDALVLDVKTGSGAFMAKEEDAVRLPQIMVDTARRMGKNVSLCSPAWTSHSAAWPGTLMKSSSPSKCCGATVPRICANSTFDLCAWMFYLGERTNSVEEGRSLAEEMLASGKALERFRQCIQLQGGDARVIDDYSLLPTAKHETDVTSPKSSLHHRHPLP